VHCEEDASVNWFKTIANIWKSATDDDRHGVVKVAVPHLVLNKKGRYVSVIWLRAIIVDGHNSSLN
jgi:hypothetical protein